MKIQPVPGEFTICKVSDYTKLNMAGKYLFVQETPNERSLVVLSEDTPKNAYAESGGWRAFRTAEKLDFSMTGVLAGISALLADAEIPILAISTFDADYVFVKKENEQTALEILENAGYEIEAERKKIY